MKNFDDKEKEEKQGSNKKSKKRIRYPRKEDKPKHYVLDVHDSNLSGATGFGK